MEYVISQLIQSYQGQCHAVFLTVSSRILVISRL